MGLDSTLYYECNTAITEEWFSKARINKTWKIDVGFIPSHMEEIYWIQDDTKYESCILTDDAKQIFLDAPLEELAWHEERQTKQKAAYQGTMMQRNTDHLREIETIIKGATDQQKVVSLHKAKTRAKPKATEIRKNRKAESEFVKQLERTTKLDIEQDPIPTISAPAPTTKSASSYDDIFSAFQEEDNE